ncbi:hypothetical protein GCM10010266_12890 [Streptomyces griseomycini]|nr:hypothetical protein GCM10010266_12890 [Streptomyces griseomycini]
MIRAAESMTRLVSASPTRTARALSRVCTHSSCIRLTRNTWWSVERPNSSESMMIGRKEAMGPSSPRPSRSGPQPHWKIATRTPKEAAAASRFITAAVSGTTRERKASSRSGKPRPTIVPTNSDSSGTASAAIRTTARTATDRGRRSTVADHRAARPLGRSASGPRSASLRRRRRLSTRGPSSAGSPAHRDREPGPDSVEQPGRAGQADGS